MSLSESFSKKHVKKWIDGWNNHDIKTVLSMYSKNIEFSSPKIKIVFPDRNVSKINNKKDLEDYWSKALKNNFPSLKLTDKEVLVHNNKIILEYYATLDCKHKTSVIEKFERDRGMITKSDVFYSAEEKMKRALPT